MSLFFEALDCLLSLRPLPEEVRLRDRLHPLVRVPRTAKA